MNKDRTGNSDPAASPRPAVDIDVVMEQIRAEIAQRQTTAIQTGLPEETGAATDRPPLTTDEIMARVRVEVARRRSANSANAVDNPIGSGADTSLGAMRADCLPRWQPAASRLPEQEQYVLNDFLRFDDADFVDVAYQALLRRSPDSEGRQDYLDALRSGAVSKVEILGNIRFSEEGRRQGVHVDGLLLPYKLHRWRHVRAIGWFLGMGMAVWRLPRLAWRLQGMEAAAARESQQTGRLLAQVSSEVDRRFAHADSAIKALRDELTQSVTSRVEGLRVAAARVDALQAAFESTNEALRAKNEERETRSVALQKEVQEELAEQDAKRTELAETFASKHAEVLESLAALEARRTALAEALHASNAQRSRDHKDLANRLTVYDAALAKLDEQARNGERSVRAMFDRLTVFPDAASRREKGESGQGGEDATSVMEAQYASFEHTFRGDREQIKQRATHYLGTLAASGIKPGDDGIVLDLGSGRGEWLEVLAEHGYRGRGVDLNRGMLQESEARGHDVVEADVLGYLRVQDNDSVAAITSMHLVEHIPHPVLIQLLDEALRVLRPGGVLILETPNPENVLVGSCMFYMDPTHLNPIPPPLLQWVVQVRGFEQANIERLSEHRGPEDLKPVSEKVPGAAQINQMVAWFTAPQDYAVIARKLLGRREYLKQARSRSTT